MTIRFSDEDDAVAIANDSDFDLVAGVFTRDISRALRFADRVEAGQVYDGWISRELISFYERHVRVLFSRFGARVKYWLTFNEINSLLQAPFMSGGINTPKAQLAERDLYQAMHHELVASALATRIARELAPGSRIGCIVLSLPAYPLTPSPEDMLTAMEADQANLVYSDVHTQGRYPGYFLRTLREKKIELDITEEYREVLSPTPSISSPSATTCFVAETGAQRSRHPAKATSSATYRTPPCVRGRSVRQRCSRSQNLERYNGAAAPERAIELRKLVNEHHRCARSRSVQDLSPFKPDSTHQ